MSPVNQQFCQKNWHHLIYYISSSSKGKEVYAALYNEKADILPIWPTVAAIKTMRIWAKSLIISDIATGCSELAIFFQASLEAWRIEIAKIILKKME
ncbi:MAG: hypothetical protein PHE20_01130 [Patescibacteria group bacterium]|nr:hypothetical protein [Patescibacteria group bacterium]